MKFIVFAISFVFVFATGQISARAAAQKPGSLKNCFDGNSAEFFANDLEKIAQDSQTPVLLLNDKNQIVGVMAVTADRAKKYPFAATKVSVEKVSLCGSFDVTDFYYTDGPSENLLEWTAAKTGAVAVTQDEGELVINAKVGKKESYATRIDVEFKAYDVFTEIEEYTAEDRKSPDFDNEWGLPKGAGSFHFFVPANWKLVP